MDFKPIDISMKQMVEHYTAKWKLECSEYTFSNLLMWGCGGNIMLAEDEQALSKLTIAEQQAAAQAVLRVRQTVKGE